MATAGAIALAIVGIMVLVVLHELGHFFAARATGMRVEKLYLFFGKPIWKIQRGETEYGVGSVPLGGYAKITGMNPEEEIETETGTVPATEFPRSYYAQPVWKRIVVILAGPAVNVLVAFVILFALAFGTEQPRTLAVGAVEKHSPAQGQLKAGDELVSVDGVRSTIDATAPTQNDFSEAAEPLAQAVASHVCAGELRDGCVAKTPVTVVVRRDGQLKTLSIRPVYDGKAERMRLGFAFGTGPEVPLNPSVPKAIEYSADSLWYVTSETGKTFAQLFKAEEREKLGSVVGAVETTRQAIQIDLETALRVIALVSLSLALINLFPFLPLDGGHVFWSLVEKVRGRRVPLRTMEQASVIGFMLIAVIFVIGFTNDIERFSNGGFDLR
jgi:regulator of sigma E protease